MQPNKVKQVGGSHYGSENIYGHWDYCKEADTPYLVGNATKYLMRWRQKNGIQDLEKSLSYVDKIMEGMPTDYHELNHEIDHINLLERMFEQNKVGIPERLIMRALHTFESYEGIKWARDTLFIYIEQEKEALEINAKATKAYVNQG